MVTVIASLALVQDEWKAHSQEKLRSRQIRIDARAELATSEAEADKRSADWMP